ncbi:MAG: NnrS family protein, partial [Gammaproteobacteria bacterium]|nr:NnrS family protein [Gammaproteobacteria bacterium]
AGILNTWYPLPTWAWLRLLATAAFAHAIRLILWQPYHRHRDVMLWMLPVAYAWIPITLALRAYAQVGAIPTATAVHALTLGAIGGLMVAMMMRSALGHTGRIVTAGSAEIAVFTLVQLAAIVRVLSSLIPPDLYQGAVIVSGVLWSLAFMVFVFRYWPILTRPRVDGRSG